EVSRSWIYKLLERFEQGGYASLEPRSRRPRSCSHQVATKVDGDRRNSPGSIIETPQVSSPAPG
ncbi:helix-turn-helix domain-containing protein, partial [bacterium]